MEPAKNNKLYIFLLLIFFIIFAGTALVLRMIGGTKTKEGAISTIRQQPAVLPTVPSKEGSLQLQFSGDTSRFSLNQPVTVKIVADSHNENIVGWDALISYDPTTFDFVQAASVLPDFKVYSFDREDHVSLSSIKLLQSTTTSVFKDEVVATVTFQPKTAGKYTLTLAAEIGKEKTNLVNTVTKQIYPQLNSLSLEIY